MMTPDEAREAIQKARPETPPSWQHDRELSAAYREGWEGARTYFAELLAQTNERTSS